jgi:site-specific DNA recombinase
MNSKTVKPTKAVIYCRVSSEQQVTGGDGLNAQETHCREYAERQGLNVMRVFKDAGVSGKHIERPAFCNLLAFLHTQKESVVVIIDNIDRFARGVSAHWELRGRISLAGGILESPNFTFGDDPAERLVENVMASTAQFERENNAKRVYNCTKARLMNGFWPFPVPIGYKYIKGQDGGKHGNCIWATRGEIGI